MVGRGVLLTLAAAAAALCGAGYYFSGVTPRQYLHGEKVGVYVDKLTSTKTQLPLDYYSLPVCAPERIDDAIGVRVWPTGDVRKNSLYLRMDKAEGCKVLCTTSYDEAAIATFQEKIRDEYRVHWTIDDLQGHNNMDMPSAQYKPGFPLGHMLHREGGAAMFYVYNHVKFQIRVHEDAASFEGLRVVGFIVDWQSINHKRDADDKPMDCALNGWQTVMQAGEVVSWTYDVEWVHTDVPWASRWDVYVNARPGAADVKTHWFTVSHGLLVVVFLAGMVAMAAASTLHRRVARKNEEQTTDEALEAFGWKLMRNESTSASRRKCAQLY